MRKIWWLTFIITQNALGQPDRLDSLERVYANAKDTETRLAVLKDLVNTSFTSDLNQAMEYARAGVLLAEKSDDKVALPEFYEMKGRMHANLLQLNSAVFFFNKALAGYSTVKNKKGQATTLFKFG